MNHVEFIVYDPGECRPVSKEMDRRADRDRKRRWLRFSGGLLFLLLWNALWVAVLWGWCA